MTYSFDQMMKDIEGDRQQDTAEAYKRHGQDVQAGRAEPREYYRYSNTATQDLASTFARWTGVPDGNRNQFKCVAKLLTEYEDLDLLNQAVQTLANKGRISLGVDMYYMRMLVQNEAARLRAIGGKDKYTKEPRETEGTQKYLKGLGYDE